MAIIVSPKEYPASFANLQKKGVPLITKDRAIHQDIRPLHIGLLNLMPTAVMEDTEEQFFSLIGGTPLQILPELITFDHFIPSKKRKKHLDAFYRPWSTVKQEGLDGLIVTGANIEDVPFADVLFWQELKEIVTWAHAHVASTLYSCWGMHAALNILYGIERETYRDTQGKQRKLTGVFAHPLPHHLDSPFTRGMNDVVLCPHSRWSGVKPSSLLHHGVDILLENEEAGVLLGVGRKGREVYLQGHPEYAANSLQKEYERDLQNPETRTNPQFPKYYFPKDDPSEVPLNTWRITATVLFTNWINHVYQTTHFELGKGMMEE